MFKAMINLIWRYKQQKISKNTFDVLRPINIISYVTGFRAFEYPQGHFWLKLNFLYAIVLYSIYVAGWNYQEHLRNDHKVYNLQKAVYQITSSFSHIVTFVVVLVGCHQSKALKLCVRRIHEVDVTLRALGSPGCFNIIYKKTIGLLTFVFSQLLLFIALYMYTYIYVFSIDQKTIVIFVSIFELFYGQIIEYILIIEFFIIVSIIGSEYQRVNYLLGDINVLPSSSIAMELLDHNNSKNPFSTKKSFFDSSAKLFTVLPYSRRLRSHLQMSNHEIIKSRRLLQTIRQIHLELYRVSKRISMIYGVQTSMEISLCILYITYFIYNIYYTYEHNLYNALPLIITTVGICLLCFNNSIKIFSINYICEKTSQQAQRTNELIYTFYGQSTDSELQEEMEMFSLQMMHCRVMYSASGLYAFNFKNICATVGVITTYVVIMIQVTSSIQDEIS